MTDEQPAAPAERQLTEEQMKTLSDQASITAQRLHSFMCQLSNDPLQVMLVLCHATALHMAVGQYNGAPENFVDTALAKIEHLYREYVKLIAPADKTRAN